MHTVSGRKIHVAPFARQERAIRQLLRTKRYRNVTEFVREAIDYYLERLGRPTLTEQARQMAEDFHRRHLRDDIVERAQDASRVTDERW